MTRVIAASKLVHYSLCLYTRIV